MTKSTGAEVGRPDRSTDVHSLVHVWLVGTVARSGRPSQRAELSVFLGRPGGRPVAGNGQNLTVGRSTGSVFLADSAANGYIFLGAINTPLMASFL